MLLCNHTEENKKLKLKLTMQLWQQTTPPPSHLPIQRSVNKHDISDRLQYST